MRKTAKSYLDRGWMVVPVSPKTKVTVVKWKHLVNIDSDRAELDSNWEKFPSHNIGLLTGKRSGVSVIDIDNKEYSPDPVEIARKLPETLVALTPSGGAHVFYNYHPCLPTKTKILGTNYIDGRNNGGLIVLPPSVHMNGKQYAWDVENLSEIADFPESLVDKCQADRRDKLDNTDFLVIAKGVMDGSRNATQTEFMGYLLSKYGRNPVTRDADITFIWMVLLEWNRRCVPPQPLKELGVTFNSIVSKHYAELDSDWKRELG